jgi:hypothetical protein
VAQDERPRAVSQDLLSPLGPPDIGSKEHLREWRELLKIIRPAIDAAWKDKWGAMAATWKTGRRASDADLARANQIISQCLAAILANAILFEDWGGNPAQDPDQSKEERTRGDTRQRVAKHRKKSRLETPAEWMAAYREDSLRAEALEMRRRMWHVERAAALKGRPSSPGLEHLAKRARDLFTNLCESDLAGLRLRQDFPWTRALWYILSRVSEAKRLSDRLPKNRQAQALSQFAARL